MSLCTLDHIVLLLEVPEFDNLPSWLSDNFTVMTGGKHNGQPSQNKLIIFEDGTYLELFNWYDTPPVDDDARPMSSWSHKNPGLIDYALSSLPPSTADSYIADVNEKLAAGDAGLGVSYKDPVQGGRKTNEGVEIRWKVSRARYSEGPNTPDKAYFPGGRLDSPFFCHDVTDRKLRVPFGDKDKTTHACGAKGIHAVEVMVPKEKLQAYTELYSKIIGVEAAPSSRSADSVEFEMKAPVSGAGSCKITLRAACGKDDEEWMRKRGVGITGLVLRAVDDPGSKEGIPLGNDDIGSNMRLIK